MNSPFCCTVLIYTLCCRSQKETTVSVETEPSPQVTPRLPEDIPRPTDCGSSVPVSPRPSPQSPGLGCADDTGPKLPAVLSASAPCNVGRMSPPNNYLAATNLDLSIVLSDVAEEDTDLEDGHVSQVTYNGTTGWRNKNTATDHPISLQIFRKLHDRIAWKLMDFCNIIC